MGGKATVMVDFLQSLKPIFTGAFYGGVAWVLIEYVSLAAAIISLAMAVGLVAGNHSDVVKYLASIIDIHSDRLNKIDPPDKYN